MLDAKSTDQSVRRAAFQTLSVAGSASALSTLMQALKTAPGEDKREAIRAIIYGRNWFISEQHFMELKSECLAAQYCNEVQRIERDSQPPYKLQMSDFGGHEGFRLNNHELDSLEELEHQLAQFTRGSTFRWLPTSKPMRRDELERHDMARAVLIKYGMTLLDR